MESSTSSGEGDSVEVLRWMQDCEPPVGTIRNLYNRMVARGWSVRVGHAIARIPPVRYLSDSDPADPNPHVRGDVRYAGYRLDTFTLLGRGNRPDGRLAIGVRASWERREGKSAVFVDAETFDPILGREYRPGFRAPRKPNQIELEEGVSPPLSLMDWLAIVCPVKQATKRTKRKETADVSEEQRQSADGGRDDQIAA